MSSRTFLTRTGLAAIAAAGCGVAPATADWSHARAHVHVPLAQDSRSPDTSDLGAKARATANVNHRSPDANRGRSPTSSLAGTGSYRADAGPTRANVYVPPAEGLPVPWSATHPRSHAAASATDGTDTPWAAIGLGIGGALALAVGFAVSHRLRRQHRAVA